MLILCFSILFIYTTVVLSHVKKILVGHQNLVFFFVEDQTLRFLAILFIL
jgi:hypothetical protein